MRIKHRKIQYSIMGLFFTLLFILSGIMVFGIVYMQEHQREALLEQAADNHANILSSYVWYMENTFDNTENALYSYLYSNSNISILGRNADDVARYRAKQSILSSLEQIVQMNDVIQSVWVYSPRGNEAEFLARNGYIGLNYTELCNIQNEILQIIQYKENSNMGSDKWTLMHVDGNVYLLWIMSVDNIYCGAWTSLDRLYQCFQSINPLEDNNLLIFYAPDGKALNLTDAAYYIDSFPENNWIVQGGQLKTFQSSKRTELTFSIITTEETALGGIKSSFNYAGLLPA